jgi:Mrp family chromosome partitioning ATPase
MSKNFELLRRAHWGEEYLEGIPAPVCNRTEPICEFNTESIPRQQLVPQMTDQISGLVQKLFRKPGNPAVQCVLFLDCIETSGGSSVCVRAARKLAGQVKDRVCIVDTNIDHPSVHQFFGKENQVGLIDAILLARPAEAFATRVQEGNLWYLATGSSRQKNQTRFFTNPALSSSLKQLRSVFKYLLIVAPSLSSKHELTAVAEATDGVVLVVTSSGVAANTALNAKTRLRSANVRLLGMVINQSQAPLFQSLRN